MLRLLKSTKLEHCKLSCHCDFVSKYGLEVQKPATLERQRARWLICMFQNLQMCIPLGLLVIVYE